MKTTKPLDHSATASIEKLTFTENIYFGRREDGFGRSFGPAMNPTNRM